MDPIYTLPPIFRGPSSDSLPMSGEVNWAMEKFQIDRIRALKPTPIKIGVVDTGIDRAHPLLTSCEGAKDFTGSAYGATDRHGHGTHVSGTIAASDPRIGVAAGWPLYHGKGLGDQGSGGSGLMDAIGWCIEQGCTVVSNSWGGGGPDPGWERQFREWAEAGIWLVFASGNSGWNTPNTDYPGRYMHLLNVGALNQDLTPATFSSAGDKLDTMGAGVNIQSTRPGGGFQQMSGSSMACPQVAALVAYYRACLIDRGRTIPTVYQLRDEVFKRSTDVDTPGDDRKTGPGFLTPLLLALSLTPDPPPVVG